MNQTLAQTQEFRKEVRTFVGKELYIIELEKNELTATKVICPVKNPEACIHGDHYEYKYIINFYSPAWAKLEVYQLNHGESPGIGYLWDTLLLFRKAVRKGEVRELVSEIKNKLRTVKNGDYEIVELVRKIEDFFDRKIAEYVDP